MEVLRINGQVPTVSFSGLIPDQTYQMVYTNLQTDIEYTSSSTSELDGSIVFNLDNYFINYDAVLDASVYDFSEEVIITTGIEVVRPYTDIASLSLDLNKTYFEAKEIEKISRYIIDSEVAHTFGFTRKEKELTGNGSDFLVINEKIHKLYKVYENGTLIYDSSLSNNDTNLVISKDKTSIVPDFSQDNKTEYPQVWRDRYLSRAFADGYDYLVDAEYGYKVVPQDIQEAVRLLSSDISSDSMKYINKYIESFDNEDFKVKFSKNYSSGTGNLIVDRILQKYKNAIRVGVL
jgi:hypothetical protein